MNQFLLENMNRIDLHSSIFLVRIGTLPMPDALLPVTLVDVSIGVGVGALSMLLIIFVLTCILETIGLGTKTRLR